MGANSAAKFIGLNNVVGSDCDQPAICNLELAVELNETFMLPTLLWAETTATENKNHRMWPLEFRELPTLGAMVGKLIVGEDSAWNNIISHLQNVSVCDFVSREIAFQKFPEAGHGLHSQQRAVTLYRGRFLWRIRLFRQANRPQGSQRDQRTVSPGGV